MSNQQNRVHLAIASPTEIEHTARQLMALRDGFLTSGTLARYTPRSIILESWLRCNALQVNPSRRFAPLAIAREVQLQNLREANDLLMRATRSVLSHLKDFLADSGYVIVLSDANGCLLDVIGDAAIRRRLARIDFIPGGNWSEGAAGTNAIGTAIADGHVVQLMAAEHFCDGWQDLTCTAAPIRHPLTGEVIGVLDVTGNYRLIRPFLTNFLAVAAMDVQQQYQTLLTTTTHSTPFLFLGVSASYPSYTNPYKVNLNRSHQHSDAGTRFSASPTVDDMRSQLDLQERRAYDAERLANAAGAISASLDVDVTLEKVAEQTAQLLQLEVAATCLFDETNESISLRIWCKDPIYRVHIHSLEALLTRTEAFSLIQERGEPVIIDDVLTSSLLPAALVEQLGIRSIAMLPLTTARGVIGFIAAPKCIYYHWVVADVRLALAFAAQSATAIENARLFATLQQHNRRIEVINTLAQLLSTLPDPNQHLDVILKRITEIMELDAGIILLCDQRIDDMSLVAHCGLQAVASLDISELPLRPLREVVGLVAALGESLLICNVEGNDGIIHELLSDMGLCELMAVPLLANGTILGVLLVGSHSARKLREEDLTLFNAIGQQVGLTLTNAQLLRSASEMEALREADRLKSGFIAAVSHDLRSPLTAIRASIDSLLELGGIHSARAQEHLLLNIAGQAGRLGRLVDQLLDLSRIEAGALALDRDWTELPVLITDTLAKFEGLNNGCHVECDLSGDLPLHYVDPDRLVQVIWNLLENASKYALPCSSIRVETSWTGSEVLIGVADRGPGIPSEEHEKIFQHFYRLDRDIRTHTKGSGLGLAICQGIVQAHGGRIWVEDRPGGGSVFRIALPLPNTDRLVLEALDEHELYDVSLKEH
ncbi:MAG TPA: ATP-binding protein [Ktedonobacteraceae bacterium]